MAEPLLDEKKQKHECSGLMDETTDVWHEQFISLVKNNQETNVEKKVIRELYDGWASTYDKHAEDFQLGGPSKCAEIVSQLCPDKEIAILDCGAGTGLVGVKLKHEGYKNMVALDMSQKSLDVAKQKGVYGKMVCSEIREDMMPFEDNEFDVLVCNGCITPFHINVDCFPQWVRVVKSGGLIILSLRRSNVELVETEEDFYSECLAEDLWGVIRKLHVANKWKMVSKEVFPHYLVNKGHIFEGLAFVFKVL